MNLNQLRYFQTTIKTGSYSKASQLLGVSEPTISNAVKTLERELGVDLFIRNGRKLIPTEVATTYYYYINQSLNSLDNGNIQVHRRAKQAPSITVGFFYSLGPYFIPKLVKNFWQRYPDDNLNFVQKNSLELNSDLNNNKCDLVICSFPKVKNPRMTYMPILEQEFVVVVSSETSLAKRHQISITEFGDMPLITFPRTSDVRNYIDNILLQNKVSPQRVLEFEEDRTILGFVAQNLGYAILPKTEAVDFPGVTNLNLDEDLPPQYIYLGFESAKANLLSMNHFIEFTKQYCKVNYHDVHRRI